MKRSKLNRHQETKLTQDLQFFERQKRLYLDKRFSRQNSDLEKASEVSYLVSFNIAKAKKPHNIGEELIKPSCVKMVSIMCGDQAAKMIELIPLSAETVKRRIDDMAIDCKEQLLNGIRACNNFLIQLDESTTISSEEKISP